MNTKLNILIVEDSETDAELLVRFLKKEKIKFSYLRVWDKASFINTIEENEYDLIIADQNLPQFSGMEAFRIAKDVYPYQIPFILITGSVSEKLLTEFTKEGIDDYLLKGNLLRLPSAIDKVLSKKRIEHLHQRLEVAYTDIKNSINYAKIIQEAMLPEESVLYENFPGSFIFFQPKDTLSGDFYWLKKRDDVFYIAAADCTGHGIPGAMLSMLGLNILYESVPEKRVAKPSTILGNMNEQVQKILKHGSTTLNDGMDIAFCTIDIKNKNMMYAGAKRPLFIERNKKLLKYKADRISIGGSYPIKNKFTNHSIPLQSGDRIFLFSDGYIDQFSEATDKKMNTKRLEEILVQSADLSFENQKKFVVDFFKNWKGKNEQVDDVLLMCVQIA